jgi:hypothetical protein
MGLNTRLKSTYEQPIELYVNDFDDNGQIEQILTHYQKGEPYAFATRDEITRQLPEIKKKFQSYKSFAEANLSELFGKEKLVNSTRKKVNELRSGAYISSEMGYKFVAFPEEQQFSAIGSIEVFENFESSGPLLLLSGNFYDINPQMGRYDAHYGSIVRFNNEKMIFEEVQSSLDLKGQIRRGLQLNTPRGSLILLGRNDDTPIVLELLKP